MTRIFGPIRTAPIVLSVLTVIGPVSALLRDGVWDAVFFVSLGMAVVGWYALRRPKAR